MNTTPEIQEQIKAARAVLDAVERGEEVEVRRDKGPSGIIWQPEPILGFLNVLSYYRAKSPPRYYTVNELIKEGARYLCAGTEVYTIICLSAKSGELTIIISKLESHYPIWFHQHNFTWSADGREWKSFVKES